MADVDLDDSCTLNKKIRNAQLAQYNFILGNLSSFFSMLGLEVYTKAIERRNMV